MLRLQRGTGCPAHSLHQLRRRPVGPHPGHLALGSTGCRGLQHPLDGGGPGAPLAFVYIFMSPTDKVLAIAPAIIRCYGLSFLLLPFNIFSTYYFQSLLRPLPAMAVSVARGALISGFLIQSLPALLGGNALWLAMPITELVVALPVAALMLRDTRRMGRTGL